MSDSVKFSNLFVYYLNEEELSSSDHLSLGFLLRIPQLVILNLDCKQFQPLFIEDLIGTVPCDHHQCFDIKLTIIHTLVALSALS